MTHLCVILKPWPYSPLSHMLGLILYFLEKSELLLILAVQWSSFLQYVYLPRGCMQCSPELGTGSPLSQFLNLKWKIKCFLHSRRRLMMLVVPWLCEGSLANPGSKSSWSTYSCLPRENREGFTAGRTNRTSAPSWGITFQWQGCLWEQEAGLVKQEVSSRPTMPQQGMSSTPADSHLVRSMAGAAVPGQSLQTPNWDE